MYRRKNIIIIVMCISLLLMATGYAAFSTKLNITSTGNITSTWNVYFASITNGTPTGGATNASAPTATGISATMSANLTTPGSSMTYELVLKNGGSVGAIIENINASATGSSAIIFSIGGVNVGDKIAAGGQIPITVKMEYDINVTSQPSELSKILTVSIDCIQDAGQSIQTQTPSIDQPVLLSSAILRDNNEQSDVNLSFPKTSTTTVTAGLYYTNVNTEGNRTTYYFRGPVTNNYVKFGKEGNLDIYWRIIRINEDSSIRLIYQGTSVDTAGTIGNDEYIGVSIEDPSYENSSIKSIVDNWYVANLKTNYGKYLADSGFCSDRSIGTSGDENYPILYASYSRLNGSQRPQFKCSQANDLYTLEGNTRGNQLLDNPIGLITADESRYAGIGYYYTKGEYNTYLNTAGNKMWYWTMSPASLAYYDSDSFKAYVFITGTYLSEASVMDGGEASYDIRPVINLKSDVGIVLTGTGNPGTATNPYVVVTN